MTKTPKKIEIFLPSGDPQGIRVAHITTLTVKVIDVPKDLLTAFLEMEDSRGVAVYFLLGAPDETDRPHVYIGQTSDLRKRLASHSRSKAFWQRAFVLSSKTGLMTETHALFLEWHCLQVAAQVGRFSSRNGNDGRKPDVLPPLQAECLEVFETGKVLLAILGFPIFESGRASSVGSDNPDLWFCKAGGASARGLYASDGFTVLKESIGRLDNVPSIGAANARFRSKLVEDGVMRVAGDRVVFDKDQLFGSPSMAAIAVLGRTANGWKEWKDKDNRTLDEIRRREID